MKFLIQRLTIAIFTASIAGVACAESEQDGSNAMGSGADHSSEAPAFSDLDKDQDGFINAVEATNDSTLMEKWSDTDANADRKIDRSEFSKFEMKGDQPGSQTPAAEGMSEDVQEAAAQPEQGQQRTQSPY